MKHTFFQAYDITTSTSTSYTQSFVFDSDSQVIGVDNHASRCMSNKRSDFITDIKPAKKYKVKGAGGNLKVQGVGTIKWRIADDNGSPHDIYIKNALYVPDLPISLLSPQHCAKKANDDKPIKDGTWCATYASHCVLYWDQRRYSKTVIHDQVTNTPRLYTLPQSTRYRKKVAAIEILAKTAKLLKTVAFNTEVEQENNEELNINSQAENKLENLMDYSPHESMPTPRKLEQDDDSQANSLRGDFYDGTIA